MAHNNEIVFNARSINNTRIRANELKILKLNENELSFTFGENNVNSKKRYYKDLKTLREDFNDLVKIKLKLEKEEKEEKEEKNRMTNMRSSSLNENK